MITLTVTNPWEGADPTYKMCAEIPVPVRNMIASVCPFRGSIQAVINTLLYGLVEEMKMRGVTYYSDANHTEFVRILRRRSALVSTTGGHELNVPGAAPGTCQPDTPASNLVRDVPSESGKVSGKKKTRPNKKGNGTKAGPEKLH